MISDQFTPLSGLVGGLIIGLGAAYLMIVQGRIAGISGIIGGLFQPFDGNLDWRMAFLAGLILAPVGIGFVAPQLMPTMEITPSLLKIIAAGLLVGFGARLANGCTSGHGIAGLARLSVRSLIAVPSFMAAVFVCVPLFNYILGS